MLAEDIISVEVPPLKTSDSGLKALSWMEEFKVAHLPIVNHQDFLGVISEEDIMNMNAPEEALGNHKLSLVKPYVLQNQHIYDVIKRITELNLSVIPVLNHEQQYMGLITLPDLVKNLANLSSIRDTGGIIILELNERDYSLTQIAHIIEQNDAKVLSTYIHSIPDSTRLEVTVKINRSDLRAILQTFTRYNYTVKASYYEHGTDDDLDSRYGMLMNYINM